MALRIKASCIDCDEVELGVLDVTLYVYQPEGVGEDYYRFVCPECGISNEKYATEHIEELLMGAGVAVVVLYLPDEVLEPKVGGPIDYDDLLNFHLAMENDAWMDELASDG